MRLGHLVQEWLCLLLKLWLADRIVIFHLGTGPIKIAEPPHGVGGRGAGEQKHAIHIKAELGQRVFQLVPSLLRKTAQFLVIFSLIVKSTRYHSRILLTISAGMMFHTCNTLRQDNAHALECGRDAEYQLQRILRWQLANGSV
jgi:hypothetical protein